MISAPPLRVALVGKSGAGKSNVADIFATDYYCSLIKTGAVCRAIAIMLFGNDDKSSTQALDDVLRELDKSIFLKAALRTAPTAGSIVIDSLRFYTDVVIARDLGCHIVRVHTPDEVRVSRLAARGQVFDLAADGRHLSETELDGLAADETIVNVGTLDELKAAVRAVAQRLS